MKRVIFLLSALGLGSVLALPGSQFWEKKDYHEWSKHECRTLLTDSPWARTYWAGSPYHVQLRSALPIRQAIVRQMQLEQNYEGFSTEQRQDFDTRADDFLSRRLFTEMIVLRVTGGSYTNRFRAEPPEDFTHRVFLITSNNEKIPTLRYMMADDGFDFVFPRQYKGRPIVGPGSKFIRFEFPVGVNVSNPDFSKRTGLWDAGTALIEFKVNKMLINGQYIY